MYLDCAVTRAETSDEGAPTFIRGVHADAGARPGVAGFFDAALDVSWAGAVACEVETLLCAVGCVLACTCSILSYYRVSIVTEGRHEGWRDWERQKGVVIRTGVLHDWPIVRSSSGKGTKAVVKTALER